MGYCALGAIANAGAAAAFGVGAYNIYTGNIPEPQPSGERDSSNDDHSDWQHESTPTFGPFGG